MILRDLLTYSTSNNCLIRLENCDIAFLDYLKNNYQTDS